MVIDIDTIKTVVKGMKNGKSPDGDGIMTEHLKYGGTALLGNLEILFSKIIQEQKIPEKFKNGIITPVYKQEGHNSPGVAHLSLLTKHNQFPTSCEIYVLPNNKFLNSSV